MAHAGSWLGLPDFGITEAIGGVLGANRTAQGGSNIRGSVSQAVSAPAVLKANQNLAQAQGPMPINKSSSYSPTSSGGSSGLFAAQSVTEPTGGSSEPSAPSYEDQLRSSINSGWDSYESQLNSMLNTDLPNYRTDQQNIAQNSANLATTQAGTQRTSSERAVNEQQASSLRDLGENVRNLFQSGNIFLGSRGAGDSSAANQYAYGITKMGTKARGDILAQANSRMNQIGDIYNSEVNRIQTDLNTRMGQIADWFGTQQQNLKYSLANSGLNRQKDLQALSTNLYNQAMSYLNQISSEAATQRQQLTTWAENNSKSTAELIKNLQTVQQMPAFTGIQAGMPTVDASGNFTLPAVGYGGTSTTEKDIFGQPIRG